MSFQSINFGQHHDLYYALFIHQNEVVSLKAMPKLLGYDMRLTYKYQHQCNHACVGLYGISVPNCPDNTRK